MKTPEYKQEYRYMLERYRQNSCANYLTQQTPENKETELLRGCLVWVLKFNKHCSIFVLFDKKFSILD
jgi:hypothetical protein